MATTKFYLEARNVKPGKEEALKIAVTHKGMTALIPLDVLILPSQWDKRAVKRTGHPNKSIQNVYILVRAMQAEHVGHGLRQVRTSPSSLPCSPVYCAACAMD